MRLWSLHPRYLDRQGLLACWREGLLAQKVLAGKTKGYRNHPQLIRFRAMNDPQAGIGSFLAEIAQEAKRRGYHFDVSKIGKKAASTRALGTVTHGQMAFETSHLLNKLKIRTPPLYQELKQVTAFKPHPIFRRIAGSIEDWERV